MIYKKYDIHYYQNHLSPSPNYKRKQKKTKSFIVLKTYSEVNQFMDKLVESDGTHFDSCCTYETSPTFMYFDILLRVITYFYPKLTFILIVYFMCINFKILFMLKEEGVKMKFKNITIVTKLRGAGARGPGDYCPTLIFPI